MALSQTISLEMLSKEVLDEFKRTEHYQKFLEEMKSNPS